MKQKLNGLRKYEMILRFISIFCKFPIWAIFAFFVASLFGKVLYSQLYVFGNIEYFTFVLLLNFVVAFSFWVFKKGYVFCCKKLDGVRKQIYKLEQCNNVNKNNQVVKNRFNLLSRDKQLKLLSYIRDDLSVLNFIDRFSEKDKVLLQNKIEDIFCMEIQKQNM